MDTSAVDQSDQNHIPRVLLADDHPSVLRATLRLVERRFNVVSTVANGKSALESTLALCPDIVILDIAMPLLDGLQVALQLKTLQSPAKVVFLTMHSEEDYIVSSLAAGARAYILKARMTSDLPLALDRVVRDRMFISSNSSMNGPTPSWWAYGACRHTAEFYSNEDSFLDNAAESVASALESGDGAVLILTEVHRRGIDYRLEARGLNVSEAVRQSRYLAFDAVETLASFMSGEDLDLSRCASALRGIATCIRADKGRQSRGVVVYGEMVALLCERGRPDLALQLERMWSDLVTPSMFVKCPYPIGGSVAAELASIFSEISKEHCAVTEFEYTRTAR